MRGTVLLVGVGWLIVVAAIGAIAMLIVPIEARTVGFWIRLGWTEILASLVAASWLFFIAISSLNGDAKTRYGGIAPMMSIAVSAYALLSVSAMLAHAILPASDVSNRVHLGAQIVLLAGFGLLFVLLQGSRIGATIGTVFDTSLARSPEELRALLLACESSMTAQLARNLQPPLRRLRDTLQHSISDSTATSEDPRYQALSEAVSAFCASLPQEETVDSLSNEAISSLVLSANQLASMAKSVSASLVRR
jgi:hypothetical protein